MNFDYFYGEEANTMSFYRIPRQIIKGEEFKTLSTDAKLLYGLLLDRMGLSEKNGWRDKEDKVFIYYPLTEIQEDLNCGHDKASRLLAELDSKKGIGLIHRVHQGLGKPDMIYVMRFYSEQRSGKSRSQEYEKSEGSEPSNQNSDVPKTGSQACGNSDVNYINNNYTDSSYTDQSISPRGYEDVMDEIKEQVEYFLIEEQYPTEDTDCILDIICEVLCSTQPQIKVGKEMLPATKVQARFKKLNYDHLVYVLDSLGECTSKIRNIKAYLITALYNAPLTIDMYYSSAVRHDLYGGKHEKQNNSYL